jgi:HEAT repeat protein
LLTLAENEKEEANVRERAEVLRNLGRADDLLVLARDEKVRVSVRERAAKALGQFADARVLPDLERIAQEDKDEVVREAAREAIVRIRRRV